MIRRLKKKGRGGEEKRINISSLDDVISNEKYTKTAANNCLTEKKNALIIYFIKHGILNERKLLLVLNFVVILPDKFDDVLAKFLRADTENVQFTGLFSPPFFPHHPDPAGSGRRCPSSSLPLHHWISWAEPSHQRQGKYSNLIHPPHHNLIHVFFFTGCSSWFFPSFFFFSPFFFPEFIFFSAFADSWQLRTICHQHKSRNQSFQHPTQRGRGWFLTITTRSCHLGRLTPSKAGFLASPP